MKKNTKMKKLIFNDHIKNENMILIIKNIFNGLRNIDYTLEHELKLYCEALRNNKYNFIDIAKINDKESFMGLCWIFKNNDQYLAISFFGIETRIVDYSLACDHLDDDSIINEIKEMKSLISNFFNTELAIRNIEKRLKIKLF